MLLAKSLKLSIQWMETDASNVVSAVSNLDYLGGPAGCIIEDILALCKDVGILKCQAIPRSGNGVAHTLAALAFFFKEEKLWQNVMPSSIVSVVCISSPT